MENKKKKRSKKNKKKEPIKEEKVEIEETEPEIVSKQPSNLYLRTISAVVLIVGVIIIISMGHWYCACFVFVLQFGIFNEILKLKRDKDMEEKSKVTIVLLWIMFLISFAFSFIRHFKYKFDSRDSYLLTFLIKYHTIILLTLYLLTFCGFIMKLQYKTLAYQLRLFFSSTYIMILNFFIQHSVNVIYGGLIWFICSVLLVTVNDLFAYIFGKLFGRTQLIKLSPKKTVEGFIGGMISTCVFAIILSKYIDHFQPKYLICPQDEVFFTPFMFTECETPEMYIDQYWNVPFLPQQLNPIKLSEFNIHMFICALFACFIAPFGGFFASGLKRSLKIKDFANLIPGHGGLLDRLDCQIVMIIFLSVYMTTLVLRKSIINRRIIGFIDELNEEQRILAFERLKELLGMD